MEGGGGGVEEDLAASLIAFNIGGESTVLLSTDGLGDLVEVVVSDEVPDDESIWTDAGDDDGEEGFEEDDNDDFNEDDEQAAAAAAAERASRPPAIDMSLAVFRGHSDSVYCAAIHPNIPGTIITGRKVLATYT